MYMYIIFFKLYLLFIRLVCELTPEGITSFEGVLFPIFQIILQQDIMGMNQIFIFIQSVY